MAAAHDIDDGLTDEERAALIAEEGDSEPVPAEDPVEAEAETAAAAEVDPVKDETPAAEAAADPVIVAPTASAEASTILVSPPPADAEARLTDIATRKDDLLTQFDDGDITAREYQKQLDALLKEERKVEFEMHEAQLATKMEQQRLQNEWTTTCNSFVETHPVYKDNPRLYKALDAEVRELATKPETANWNGQKFLDEAHKALKAAFGFNEPASAKPAAKHNPAANLPPNLAKVPAAEVEDTNGGRFAVLDRMASSDPLGYEDAISRMSESERNAYLAS